MKVVTMKTENRSPNGTSEARRTRRGGRLPAVIYGEEKGCEHVSLDMHDFTVELGRGARVIDLSGEAGVQRVLLRDLQWDALGAKLLHADFVRTNPTKQLSLRVPVELSGIPKGIAEGGILSVPRRTVELSCLPGDIPERVEVDVTHLELGTSLLAGELTLPEKVSLAEDASTIIATILVPRGIGDEEEADEATEGEGDGEADASGESK